MTWTEGRDRHTGKEGVRQAGTERNSKICRNRRGQTGRDREEQQDMQEQKGSDRQRQRGTARHAGTEGVRQAGTAGDSETKTCTETHGNSHHRHVRTRRGQQGEQKDILVQEQNPPSILYSV